MWPGWLVFEFPCANSRLFCFHTMKDLRFWRFCTFVGSLLFLAQGVLAQTPHWIWNTTNDAPNQVLFFRKTFILKKELLSARLSADADDGGDFYINGKKVATVKDWNTPAYVDVT